MKITDTAIILAGGKSSRMGFDKQLLSIGKQPLIIKQIEQLSKIFQEIIIVTNTPAHYKNSPCIIVEDEKKNFGPLGGIHAGLKASSSRYSYVIACDMPYMDMKYIQYMKDLIAASEKELEAVVTMLGEWLEPFNGFYGKTLISKIEEKMQQHEHRILTLLKEAEVLYIEEYIARKFSPEWEMFINLNTEEDVKRYLAAAKRSESGGVYKKG
ncbi:molybdenum cofactor guanylyltransferase [Geosporobacter ferrireducens]|uniref:Probable molybdenum cofactor guanylyltransferase n=1 Tax=Geosporobacter ferrireducens TaxID=1424294 RepID=A0A1D8GLH0_9FIRM|nr:molybdenum cofactor guanylyltransferase [Geosporobacter ferrireducens]AOT71753.1 hypothetical protein Gferi_20780 [Geosporobacter ferrireducens]MTI55537.1 molybdenum cofactor guanylyltransferase [Geosporobacter ferrireducens]